MHATVWMFHWSSYKNKTSIHRKLTKIYFYIAPWNKKMQHAWHGQSDFHVFIALLNYLNFYVLWWKVELSNWIYHQYRWTFILKSLQFDFRYTNPSYPTKPLLRCPRQYNYSILRLGVHIQSFAGCTEITHNTSSSMYNSHNDCKNQISCTE